MDSTTSNDIPRMRPPLSFFERNMFMLGGLVAMGTLAAVLFYGWVSFLEPNSDGEPTEISATETTSPPAATESAPRGTEAPPLAEAAPSVAGFEIVSQGRYLAAESLSAAVTEDEISKASAILSKFFSAKSWHDKAPYVYDADRLEGVMQRYYDVEHKTDLPTGTAAAAGIYRMGTSIIQVRGYRDPAKGLSRDIILRRQMNGAYLLDWEALVGAGEMSLEEFLRTKPSKPTLFRVYATLGDHQAKELRDARRFLCVRLLSPDLQRSAFAFCEKGSGVAQSISGVLAESKLVPVTVRLSFAPGATSAEDLRLDEFVSPHWIGP